jgi:hypothetical protein
MKYCCRLLTISIALLWGTAQAEQSNGSSEQFTGWITDAKCAKAGHYKGDSHKKCIAAGETVVFVDEADKTIYVLSNADGVKDKVGKRVTLSATFKEDALEAEAVTVIVGAADEE